MCQKLRKLISRLAFNLKWVVDLVYIDKCDIKICINRLIVHVSGIEIGLETDHHLMVAYIRFRIASAPSISIPTACLTVVLQW